MHKRICRTINLYKKKLFCLQETVYNKYDVSINNTIKNPPLPNQVRKLILHFGGTGLMLYKHNYTCLSNKIYGYYWMGSVLF